MSKFCPNCGTQNDGSAKFCLSCGTPLQQSQAGTIAPSVQIEQAPVQQAVPIGNGIAVLKIKRVSSLLRNIKDFSEGYAPIIEDMITIKAMQERGEVKLTEEDAELISQRASDVFRIVKNINSQYQSLRYNTVYNFLKIYWGEDKVIDVGHNKGKQLTLNMIMDMADKDINGVDRWISSMGDSSDALLSLIDKAVKVSHSNRLSLLE